MGKQTIATKKDGAIVVSHDYGTDASKGMTELGPDDFLMPFLNLLQALSPQVAEHDPEGAEAGIMMNSVTEELYPKDGVEFIPVRRDHVFVEWKPDRGGFVSRHEMDSEAVKTKVGEFPDWKHADTGNEMVDTFYLYGLLCQGPRTKDDNLTYDSVEPIVIAFSSTKIKPYKQLMTKLDTFLIEQEDGSKQQPPLFAHRVKITTEYEKRDAGNSFNFRLNPAGGALNTSLVPPNADVFALARKLSGQVETGAARPVEETRGAVNSDEGDVPF